MTIYTECKADTALLSAILNIPKRDIIHEIKGKFEVCKSLERKKNSKVIFHAQLHWVPRRMKIP